jgi:hypothetical protein
VLSVMRLLLNGKRVRDGWFGLQHREASGKRRSGGRDGEA